MKPDRFDALVKRRGGRWSRRTALGAASVAALAGLTPLRLGRTGTAQDASTPAASPAASPGATPVATPAASPGPLDLITGSPSALDDRAGLGRLGGCCSTWDCLDGSGITVGSVRLPADVCPDPSNPYQARASCNAAHAACAPGCRAFCSFFPEEEDLQEFKPA